MTAEDYKLVCARIYKAESLPSSVLEDAYLKNVYHDLCEQACVYEIAAGAFPWHGIHDKIARTAAQKLVRTIVEINDLSGCNNDALHAKSRALLTDLMAFAVAAGGDNTLDIFGYKEAAEDDE